MLLLLLFEESTVGLFAWGSGSLIQSDLNVVTQMAPVVAAGAIGALLMGHRLDVIGPTPGTTASMAASSSDYR